MVANGPEPSRQPVRKIDLDYWWYGDFLSAVGADIQRLTKMAAVADSETLVNDMTTDIRTISYLLHPPLLDEAGLASALRWYVEGLTTRSEMRVALEVPDDFDRLPRDLETAIFRVVQECLTNVHRHSGSPVAKIRLSRSANDVQLVWESEVCEKEFINWVVVWK